jgi:hypothetical protein
LKSVGMRLQFEVDFFPKSIYDISWLLRRVLKVLCFEKMAVSIQVSPHSLNHINMKISGLMCYLARRHLSFKKFDGWMRKFIRTNAKIMAFICIL